MSLLERILADKRREVEALRQAAFPTPSHPTLAHSLRRAPGEPLRLITEIKLRSPSAGALSRQLSVAERAAAYERAGAAAISVLCDGPYFDGAYEHVQQARAACGVPLLAKEFVVDEVQLDAARAFGADLVLLIVRCLSPDRVAPLVAAARSRGLEPLVEVTSEAEAAIAVEAAATLIGVNARDLDTLQMDSARASRVLARLPSTVVSCHLSGLRTPEDVRAVAATSTHAALVGEALMRQDDPEPLLRALVAAS